MKFVLLPTKLKYKLMVTFMLMSVMPMLVGVYIASLLFEQPSGMVPMNILSVCAIILCSLMLSMMGFHVSRQLVEPIQDFSVAAKDIAEGKLDNEPKDLTGSDEIEDLSRSLKLITRNARELLEKVDRLSLKDKLTGLYNASYIRERLDEEIQRAIQYQTPCSFAYFGIANLETFTSCNGAASTEALLKRVADIFNHHVSQLDRAARLNEGDFAAIFPNRNKRNTIDVCEKIRRDVMALEQVRAAEKTPQALALCAGVSEDPIDGVSADLLYIKAQDRMKAVRARRSSSIEAFI